MRWDTLFADLEAQAAAAAAEELAGEVAERTRLEYARIAMADRLDTRVGTEVTLRLPHLGRCSGLLERVGPDWLLVDLRPGPGELVVATRWLVSVADLGPAATQRDTRSVVGQRLDLRYALRRLARERCPVTVTLADGSGAGGTIDRVGEDHLDLAEHPAGEPRRPSAVRAIQTIALPAVVAVRSR